MPDPLIGAVVAKAANSAESSAKKAMPGLMSRVLGPSADELGELLRIWTAYKLRNVRRIIEAADRKADSGDDDATVHPRVAHQVLDSGSYCDNEVIQDYYGGLLAAARTPEGGDDRAVAWSSLLTGMSSLQVTAHYLLYREWAARLHGRTLNLGISSDRTKVRMDVDLVEFISLIKGESELDANSLLTDSIVGLARIGLLTERYEFGTRGHDNASDSPYEHMLRIEPTPSGLELYGWAQGLSNLVPGKFTSDAIAFEVEPPIPRLTNVTLMLLDTHGIEPGSP